MLDDNLVCPDCQSDDLQTTTMGWDRERSEDPNKWTCLACGWTGRRSELVDTLEAMAEDARQSCGGDD